MQAPVIHAGMAVPLGGQSLVAHMAHAPHVPILPRMPGSAHAGLVSLARGAHAFATEEMVRKRNGRGEEERGVNDGADALLRAAKKARNEATQPSLRREEPPFHVAIPARAPRGAYEPEEVARESGYIGVRWSRKKAKWRVRIKANGKDNHVGFFPDAVAAAIHYDNAAKRFFPQWKTDPSIRLNFPDEDDAPAAPESALPAARPDPAPAAPLPAAQPRSGALASGIHAILAASGSGSEAGSAPPSSRSVGVSTAPPSGAGLKGGGAVEVPTVLKPLLMPASEREHGAAAKANKSSLEHLLYDKTALVRTPSPQDASATPSTGLGGTASSISTPATLPSPSTLWSPSVSRCQSTSRGPHTETPPTIAGPPRLSAVACSTAGFVAPAVCVPGQKKEKEGAGAEGGEGGREGLGSVKEELHMELEALRGLVELARENAPAVDFAIAHHKKVTARPARPEEAGAGGSAGKKRDAASKKARERGRAVRAALTEAADTEEEEKRGAAGAAEGDAKRARVALAGGAGAVARRCALAAGRPEGYERVEALQRKSQNYRGVTWDKVKQMWRVRLCLAGGGREHIGYFSDEHEGALAYARALQRLKNELPAVRQEGGAAGAAGSGPGSAGSAGAGSIGVGGEEAAQRGAFSQVGAEAPREVCIAGMQPSEPAGAAAAIIGVARSASGGFQSVPAQGSAS